jgi:hypothetical protein
MWRECSRNHDYIAYTVVAERRPALPCLGTKLFSVVAVLGQVCFLLSGMEYWEREEKDTFPILRGWLFPLNLFDVPTEAPLTQEDPGTSPRCSFIPRS